jgi:hypothetical protein
MRWILLSFFECGTKTREKRKKESVRSATAQRQNMVLAFHAWYQTENAPQLVPGSHRQTSRTYFYPIRGVIGGDQHPAQHLDDVEIQ